MRSRLAGSMAFKKHTPKKIEVDTTTIAHDSPEVTQRLARIEENYDRFDQLMIEIEAKMPEDEKPTKSVAPRKPK